MDGKSRNGGRGGHQQSQAGTHHISTSHSDRPERRVRFETAASGVSETHPAGADETLGQRQGPREIGQAKRGGRSVTAAKRGSAGKGGKPVSSMLHNVPAAAARAEGVPHHSKVVPPAKAEGDAGRVQTDRKQDQTRDERRTLNKASFSQQRVAESGQRAAEQAPGMHKKSAALAAKREAPRRDEQHTLKAASLSKGHVAVSGKSAPEKATGAQKKPKAAKREAPRRDDHERPVIERAPVPGTEAIAGAVPARDSETEPRIHRAREAGDQERMRIWLPSTQKEPSREEKEAIARYTERMRSRKEENSYSRPELPYEGVATPPRSLKALPYPTFVSDANAAASGSAGIDTKQRPPKPQGGALPITTHQPTLPRVDEEIGPGMRQARAVGAVNTPHPALPQPVARPPVQETKLTLKPFAGRGTLDVKLLKDDTIRGGSAVILKGTVVLNGKTLLVALKEFTSYSVMIDDDKELLRREVANVAKLASDDRCTHIMPYIGTAVHQDRTYLVSQYLTQGNMLEYLARSSTANRHKLVMQVATAVLFLHTRANLVHGDLKCENVLIKSTGDALLADFGLSTVIHKSETSNPTSTGICIRNTTRFAAPELLLGEDEQDGPSAGPPRSKTCASDVYAFGMLVLQAFTGQKPWPHLKDGRRVIASVAYNRSVHPRPTGTAEGSAQEVISDPVWEICQRCWRFDPRERPSMEWVKKKLQKHLA